MSVCSSLLPCYDDKTPQAQTTRSVLFHLIPPTNSLSLKEIKAETEAKIMEKCYLQSHKTTIFIHCRPTWIRTAPPSVGWAFLLSSNN